MPGYFFRYVVPKIAKNLAKKRKHQDDVVKTRDKIIKEYGITDPKIKTDIRTKANQPKINKKIADIQDRTRVKKMGGGMMSRRFGMNEGGKIPTTPKEKKFAALAPPRDRITYSDKIAGATGRQKAAFGGMIVKLGKAGKKFLKSKEGKDKLKEMDSKKGKKFTEKMLKKLKDAGFKGGGAAMSKLPAKEERKQKAQKRMTAANKFLKNRKRSFGSIMREKHMR